MSAQGKCGRALLGQFVLRLRVEVAPIMAFVQLLSKIAYGAVDHPAPLNGGPLGNRLCPADDMNVLLPLQELTRTVLCALRQAAIPGPNRHIGDRVLIASHILVFREVPIQHVQLALRFHREPVDRILNLDRRVMIEMTEPTADVGRTTHLPEQPVQRFGALVGIGWQECAKFLREIEQDRSGLEHAARFGTAPIHQSRYLRVRVYFYEATPKLLALANGPKGLETAAAMRCGVITSRPRPDAAYDRSLDVILLGFGTILDQGETLSSPRVINTAGPGAMVAYHAFLEQHDARLDRFPNAKRFVELANAVDPGQRHLALHSGHLTELTPSTAR